MKINVTKEYIFNDREMRELRECLIYCKHRLLKHSQAGIHRITNLDRVSDLLNPLLMS